MGDFVIKHTVQVEKQDYILIGKQAKDAEVRIVCDADDYEGSRYRVENMIRLTKYASELHSGQLPIPKYEPKKPIQGDSR